MLTWETDMFPQGLSMLRLSCLQRAQIQMIWQPHSLPDCLRRNKSPTPSKTRGPECIQQSNVKSPNPIKTRELEYIQHMSNLKLKVKWGGLNIYNTCQIVVFIEQIIWYNAQNYNKNAFNLMRVNIIDVIFVRFLQLTCCGIGWFAYIMVPLGRPLPVLGSPRKVTPVNPEEKTHALTGGKARVPSNNISIFCERYQTL